MTATPSTLAADITALLQRWNAREAEMQAWMAGAPDGGANGDGKFPLTDASGRTYLAYSLPKLQDLVEGPAGISTQAQLLAEAARDAAITARDTASTHADTATTARTDAIAARDLALTYKNDVAAMQVAVSSDKTSIEAIQTNLTALQDNVQTLHDETVTNATSASDSAASAADSAAAAATFDPALYLRASEKAQPNGLASLNAAGQLPNNQIPTVALVDTYEAASEAEQLGLVTEQGDVVIRSDLRKSFVRKQGAATGTMSDYAELLAPVSDVLSVDGRVGAIDLSDLYAPLVHSHSFETLTGKPTTLAGYGIADALKVDVAYWGANWPMFRANGGVGSISPDSNTYSYLWADDTQGTGVYLGTGAHWLALNCLPSGSITLETDGAGVDFNTTPTVGGTAVSLEGHTHSYLPLSGGNLTGPLTIASGAAGNWAAAGLMEYLGGPWVNSPSGTAGWLGVAGGGIASWGPSGFNVTSGTLKQGGVAVSLQGHTHAIADVTGLQTALDGKIAKGGDTVVGTISFQSTGSIAGGSASAPLWAYAPSGGGGAFMAFHRAGVVATYMGIDTDNAFKIGGWSWGADRFKLDGNGNGTFAGALSATGGTLTGTLYLADGAGNSLQAYNDGNSHIASSTRIWFNAPSHAFYSYDQQTEYATIDASGLRVNGVRVPKTTISTASPSGGTSGDVWFKV